MIAALLDIAAMCIYIVAYANIVIGSLNSMTRMTFIDLTAQWISYTMVSRLRNGLLTWNTGIKPIGLHCHDNGRFNSCSIMRWTFRLNLQKNK